MAINKKTDFGNTGLIGEHWALSDFKIFVGVEAGSTRVVARYAMWANADARASGKDHLRRGRRITVSVPGTDPRLSDIEAVCDAALIVETIKSEPGVRAVAPQPAVKADSSKGIVAKAAVKGVKAKRPVPGVRGGDLEGGTIV